VVRVPVEAVEKQKLWLDEAGHNGLAAFEVSLSEHGEELLCRAGFSWGVGSKWRGLPLTWPFLVALQMTRTPRRQSGLSNRVHRTARLDFFIPTRCSSGPSYSHSPNPTLSKSIPRFLISGSFDEDEPRRFPALHDQNISNALDLLEGNTVLHRAAARRDADGKAGYLGVELRLLAILTSGSNRHILLGWCIPTIEFLPLFLPIFLLISCTYLSVTPVTSYHNSREIIHS
jgi:hypothetical protein